MPRIQSDPSPSAVVLSGTLRAALVAHTKERLRHFFLFLYSYRMLMHVLQVPPGKWAGYVRITATHQVDVGMRRDTDWDIRFKKDDVSVLDLQTTAFMRVDAAHFCNLGLDPSLAGLCTQSGDERARSFYNTLEKVCGNTRLIPQRINIGPDRVVDRAHGDLCLEFLKRMATGAAPISPPFFKAYKERVVSSMTQYGAGQAANGNAAVAEAAGIYIATLTESEPPMELREQGTASRWIRTRSTHTEEVWATLLGNAEGDFYGFAFDRDSGTEISMFVTRAVA
jgi:hypothetical protein